MDYRMHAEPADPDDYPDKRLLRGFEGGAVYLAEEAGAYLVITDETSMLGMLDEEDLKGMALCTVRRFSSDLDRKAYLKSRGWA